MKEQLISFETAKLAKKKGFPQILKNWSFEYTEDGQCYSDLSIPFHKSKMERVKTPSQSLLQKWLREKYNIHVESLWVDTLSSIYVYKILSTGNAIRPVSKHYESYEDALEQGLLEGLKLIKQKISKDTPLEFTCRYCGKNFTLNKGNLPTCCFECNKPKKDKLTAEEILQTKINQSGENWVNFEIAITAMKIFAAQGTLK